MTDRELLKLAAKAAGVAGFWVDDGLNTGSDATPAVWNPITDDGDALRLAVKLEMQVSIGLRRINVAVYVDRSMNALPFNTREVNSDDLLAATRRAIVRAAAEIGRSNHD